MRGKEGTTMGLRTSRLRWLALLLGGALAVTACAAPDEAAVEPGALDEQDAAVDEPEEEVADNEDVPRVGIIYSVPDPANAGGWDRAGWVGQTYLEQELGWEVTTAENVAFPELAEVARQFADRGYDFVVFTSSGHNDAWFEVAPQYPDTWFVMLSVATELPESDNVVAFSPDMFTYGAIVGAIGAIASETGQIGAMAGAPVPALLFLFSGIIEGSNAVRPGTEVDFAYTGDWVDLATHREVSRLLAADGADVLFVVSGPGTRGVFDGARDAGSLVIGYAAEWYDVAPESTLTSVIVDKRALYAMLAEMHATGELAREIHPIGPELFALGKFHESVTPEMRGEIESVFTDIQNGDLEIPEVLHEEVLDN